MKVIAFDLFGTVFNLRQMPKEEIVAYVDHVRSPDGWKPLKLPEKWQFMEPFEDSKKGLRILKDDYIVVTMSNAPIGFQTKLCKIWNISFDLIIPLEMKKVYKPNPEAYMSICEILDVEPKDVAMVTGNRTAGDLEAADKLGMKPILIRHKLGQYKDIIDLAVRL